jgi:hypothetical protein
MAPWGTAPWGTAPWSCMTPKTATKSCDHDALAYGAMQYNHGALGLGERQKGQIVKFLQIRFILCLSFRKGLIWVTLTRTAASPRWSWLGSWIHGSQHVSLTLTTLTRILSGRYGARTQYLALDLHSERCCMLTGVPPAVCISIHSEYIVLVLASVHSSRWWRVVLIKYPANTGQEVAPRRTNAPG